MRDEAPRSDFLIGLFAEFYEEVVGIKLASRDGRLPLYLAQGERTEGLSGVELAAMASRRLYGKLARQARAVRADATEQELKAYLEAQYIMAALADEIFILELDWSGRTHWLNYLLEAALFRTHCAGRQVFAYADQLLRTRAPTSLHIDLASVILITLQLGFKGQYRGEHAEPKLREYRNKLLQFVTARRRSTENQPGFPQAYQHRIAETEDRRIAPLSRWYWAGGIAVGIYLVISSLVWVLLWQPFHAEFGRQAGVAASRSANR